MKRKILFIVCMLSLIFAIGCEQKLARTTGTQATTTSKTTTPVSTTPVDTTTPVQETTVPIEVPEHKKGQGQAAYKIGGEDAERLGVSKKLVWIVSGGVRFEEPEVINRFNEMLVNEYGCDFVVEFQMYPIEELYEDENGKTKFKSRTYLYKDIVKDMLELGQQADIIYSGYSEEFDELLEAGVYEPITERLKTEEGKKLYEAYAESVWRSIERNGELYGYTTNCEVVLRFAFVENIETANKFGVVVKEGYSFYDLGNMLTGIELPDSKNMSERILPIYIDNEYQFISMEGYYNIDDKMDNADNAIYYTVDENGKWKAVNAAEEGRLIKLWKTIKEYKDNGWIFFWNRAYETLINKGQYIFRMVNCSGSHCSNVMLADNKFRAGSKIIDVATGNMWSSANGRRYSGIHGIAATSLYKDEAFKLITLLNTEAKLSNLLAFGVEGVNYVYENKEIIGIEGQRENELIYGLIFDEKTGILLNTYSGISNNNLLHSIYLDPDNKLEYYKEIGKSVIDSPGMTYDIDMSQYSEQLDKLEQIYNGYFDNLCTGKYDDVEATVAELNAKLKEAGIDEVVKDINRQLEEAQR